MIRDVVIYQTEGERKIERERKRERGREKDSSPHLCVSALLQCDFGAILVNCVY